MRMIINRTEQNSNIICNADDDLDAGDGKNTILLLIYEETTCTDQQKLCPMDR